MHRYSSYEYAMSLTSQFYFCGVPFRLDTAPKCSLNCAYCFAMARGGRRTSTQLLANVDKLKRLFDRVFEKRNAYGLKSEILSRKIPLHFGGLSDPFSNAITSKISKEILSLLRDYDYPVVLSTKNSKELLKDSTLKILKSIKKLVVQISIISSNQNFCKIIEPRVSSPQERVQCIKQLSKEGIHCICRLQPLFPPQIRNVEQELIPMLAEAKCRHVIVEHLKLPVEKKRTSFDMMLKKMNWDAYIFYKKCGMVLVGREWLLSNKIKWENLQSIIKVLHQNNMTFGAGDYGLHHLGDTSCCCGIDNILGFNNWFRGNFSNIIREAKPGHIRIVDLEKKWHPNRSIKRILNSNCRLKNGSLDMLAYLKKKWNSPGTANAPDAFLGIHWYGDYDSDSNCIYVKEKNELEEYANDYKSRKEIQQLPRVKRTGVQTA